MKKILGACHPTRATPRAITLLMRRLPLVDLLKLTLDSLILKVRDVNFFQPNDAFIILHKGFIFIIGPFAA